MSRHFTLAATPRICLSMEARRSLGSVSACSTPFHAAAARSAVSTAIFHSGLAGIRAVSAKRRIWPGVISDRLRLPPKLNNQEEDQLFLSAVTMGELQSGIEWTRRQDPSKARDIESWADQLAASYQILPMDTPAFGSGAVRPPSRSLSAALCSPL